MPCSAREVLHLSLREVGVDLDLVDRRHHRRAVEQLCEVLNHEVADPDRADLAVSEQRLQGPGRPPGSGRTQTAAPGAGSVG
jgi:hypothetical protein